MKNTSRCHFPWESFFIEKQDSVIECSSSDDGNQEELLQLTRHLLETEITKYCRPRCNVQGYKLRYNDFIRFKNHVLH